MAIGTRKPKVTTGDREVDERQPVFKNFDDRTEKHPRASILSHFGDVTAPKSIHEPPSFLTSGMLQKG